MILFFTLVFALIVAPGVAMADPISSAIFTFLAGAGVAVGTATVIASFATRLIFGAIVSLVGQLFAEKPKGIKPQGIQTEQTTTGDTTPQKFIVGRYAAEGHAVAPAYSRSNDNHILTYILEISNVPIKGLTGRVIIDGQYTDLTPGANDPTRLDFSTLGVNDLGNPRGWLWFFDGTQTTAFNQLVDAYGDHPDRPWTNDHILQGTAYAVLEFALDREIYTGLPSVRFEAEGIALYDPRKDSSVGGSGAHRWADPDTWEFSENPQVINYNILRGITLPTGDIYGGQVPAEDLPLDNWFAAMNECDVLIGDRPQYRAGFEINTGAMEPFEVLEEMNRSSFAQISEFGGVFRVRVGAPSTPVMSLTDDDFMITEPSTYEPFPGLANTYNAITGTYVEPVDVWEGRSADAVLNPEWEAEDGGRRLTIDVGLPAVRDKSQAQQLLTAYIKDQRRFRVHRMVLPPSFSLIEPLDSISWSSVTNGYTAKVFEVISVEDRTDTLNQFVTVREREPGDVAWGEGDDVASPGPTNGFTPPDNLVPTLTVSAVDLNDVDSEPRRPAIKIEWPVDEAPSAELLKYELRLIGDVGNVVTTGTVGARDGLTVTSDGVLPNTIYEVRARYLTGMPTEWSDWMPVTTSDTRLTAKDIVDALNAKIEAAFARHDQ
ncbi:phage tail protein, partial [Pseudosulfitobacter pseudonitzschiae]